MNAKFFEHKGIVININNMLKTLRYMRSLKEHETLNNKYMGEDNKDRELDSSTFSNFENYLSSWVVDYWK